MCVRDLTRGKCQAARRIRTTSKGNSRQCGKASSSKSFTNRRERRMKRGHQVDLLCTELLSQSEAHNYHADLSYLKLEYEPLSNSPLMAHISSTTCTVSHPHTHCLLLSPASDYYDHLEQRPWSGIERVSPPIFGYSEETVAVVAVDQNCAKDDCNWNDEGLIDIVSDWHDFSPDQGFSCDSPIAKQKRLQCAETETYLPLGSSLQSNGLATQKWSVQASGPSCHDKERRSMESMANSPSKRKLEFSVSCETFEGIFRASAINHERLSPIDVVPAKTSTRVTKGSACKVEFREAMELLLEKESSTNYQLSHAYIRRLTGNSGHELHFNGLRGTGGGARRNVVNWILKVVKVLHLSSLTAAHAVALFDRSLSQRLVLDPQNDEKEELLLTAAACVWIAAKLEDSCAPHLSCLRALEEVQLYNDEKIRKMEVLVLRSLGWRMLSVTAADFLANMIAHLPALGLPPDLLASLGCRSEEIVQVILPEVAFLAYQPSVVSFSVMQYLLDECVPVHTAALMAAFHLALAVDVESKENCYRTLMDLVADTTQVSSLQSSTRGCINFEDKHLDSDDPSHPYALKEQQATLPISAFYL